MVNSLHSITIESTPSGMLMPHWLQRSLSDSLGSNLLILYPSETSRQATLNELSRINSAIDSSKHLTIKRLIRALLTDFRQPNVFDDDSVLLYKVHQECVNRAAKGKFPLLHITGKKWGIGKPLRLLQLHQEIAKLSTIPPWDSDPGVKEFRNALLSIEKSSQRTHPDLMQHQLNRLLDSIDGDNLPFSLRELSGIIILDHPPEFSEIERDIFSKISQHIPIHQLCNPGKFRLGYSGAYLQDVKWCSQSDLPAWVPFHEVEQVDHDSPWRSSISEQRTSQYHKVVVEHSGHIIAATTNLLDSLSIIPQDKILIIDADLQNRAHRWQEMLRQLGIYNANKEHAISQEPLIQELIYHLQLASGLEAWSFERLRRFANSANIFINFDLTHPTNPELLPRPHTEILEKISRSFHVLGGPGAAERWCKTLDKSHQQIGDFDDSMAIKQEETQWWLANIINLWNIVADIDFEIPKLEGCYSGDKLPLIEPLESPINLLDVLIESIDWTTMMADDARFNNCIFAVEALKNKLYAIDLEQDLAIQAGLNFIDLVKLVTSNEHNNALRIKCANVEICSPSDAFGQSANIVILAGLDSESWSMKPTNIPWLDNATKVKLGLANSDIKIRQGRHELRHILNGNDSIIVIDTSLDEAASPSPPLSEWLDDVSNDDTIFTTLPTFVNPKEYDEDNHQRSWDLLASDNKKVLKLRIFTTEYEGSTPISVKSGNKGRDIRQRSGLALQDGREVELLPHNKSSLAMAYELPINNRLRNSQPTMKDVEVGQSMNWQERNKMISFSSINLRPGERSANSNTRENTIWPNLGYKINGITVSPAIDPRPLPLQFDLPPTLQSVMGDSQSVLLPKRWSPYRLQAWLKCPRQAWLTNYLQLTSHEIQNEDLDNRTRGLLMHDIEAEIMSLNGVPVFDKPLTESMPLIDSPHNQIDVLWQKSLEFLASKSPWLSRKNAVSVHRCREVIGVTPEVWQEYLDGEASLEPNGKIANYLTASLALKHSAPLVCEWMIASQSKSQVTISGTADDGKIGEFPLAGRVDRVDELHLPGNDNTQRLIIIRDMKTVNGPKVKLRGERHRRAIFDELQLALYAKAWEAAFPDDRVIGVGITEVGENTEYYVEIDPDYIDLVTDLSIGKITTYTSNTYRDLDEEESGESNGFRAWLDERIRTALRVVDGANKGHVNPTVSDDCKFCKVRRLCPSAKLGGKL
ncbi:MAG: PD-(D/E)XK nuclease family protein [Candidatus Poseidoniaceae archaeon]|nr:PD-(D/E)XK nuclease family protein [Candidatus Poseidoniaceae archaeon]